MSDVGILYIALCFVAGMLSETLAHAITYYVLITLFFKLIGAF